MSRRGARKDTWSVTVSGNWRLTFTFIDGDTFKVDPADYH
jgi:proteic killer suppression protein